MEQEITDYRLGIELGISEFNAGDYFACHDTFESIWMGLRGENRRFFQGMIQTSVGIYHATRGNMRGAYSQLTKGLEKLAEYPGHYLGIDVEKFRNQLLPLQESLHTNLLENTETFDASHIPTIQYATDDNYAVLEW